MTGSQSISETGNQDTGSCSYDNEPYQQYKQVDTTGIAKIVLCTEALLIQTLSDTLIQHGNYTAKPLG